MSDKKKTIVYHPMKNTADFWKKYEADLAECQETKVVHMGDVDSLWKFM